MTNDARNIGRPTAVMVGVLSVLLLLPLLTLAQDEDREGWFSDEQAQAGREAYLENCSRCHSRDLNARSTYISLYLYPSLKGAFFMDRWEGESVHTLYQVIRHTMPLDAPGTLDEETYADIVAYILQENGFPAGGPALPREREDPERLRGMIIEPANMVDRPQPQHAAEVELRPAQEEAAREAEPTQEQQEPEAPDQPAAREQPQDGAWFTEAQAMRGDALFVENCARCHGRALQGVGVAPSLAGANFIARWEGETVGELFRIASSLMPLDGQGELEPQTYADLVAYILWRNGFPDGETELPPDYEWLQQLVITSDLAQVPEVP